jgi:putative ABC transport system permease protein
LRRRLAPSRGRIVRQLVTESLVLSLAGGALGLGLMTLLYGWLWAARPEALDQLAVRPSLDAAVAVFTLVVSALTALLFGLAPALRVARADLSRAIGAGRESAAPVRPRVRAALVTAQVGLATIALIAAGLFLRSLWRAEAIDPGFAHERLIAANYSVARASSPAHARELHERTLERARALPGVAAAAITDRLPLSQGAAHTIDIPGAPAGDGTGVLVPFAEVSPSYFQATGIALLAGRDFGPDDRRGSPQVAIVNRTMAERFWPGRSAVGERFRARVDGALVEIAGVVEDSKTETIGEAGQPFMYRPLWQRANVGQPFQWLIVASPGEHHGLPAAVRALLRELDPDSPADDPIVLSTRLDEALWAPRMLAVLVAGFGIVALALACAGIYGLLAVTVGQRRHEFGLRMTLGARPADVLRLVLRGGMTWVAVGLAIGILGGLLIARWTHTLRYSAQAIDGAAIGGAAALLVAVALVACVVPARRAARVDPATVLRS